MVDKTGRGKRLFRYSVVLLLIVVAAVIVLNLSLSRSKESTEILLKKQTNSTEKVVHYRGNNKHSNFDQKLSILNNISLNQLGSSSVLQIQKYPVTERGKQLIHNRSQPISATIIGPVVSWDDFIIHSLQHPIDIESHRYHTHDQTMSLKLCPTETVQNLKQKTLEGKDIEWCKWATSSTGGKVVVGKSWGNLRSITERKKFDSLNCNSVITSGINPSCDDAWGDESVTKW